MVVKLFANEVFTVDDGPPRSMYEPANTAFLQSIKRQEVPHELRTGDDVPISLSLVQIPKDYDPADFPKCVPLPDMKPSVQISASYVSSAPPPHELVSIAVDGFIS